MDGLFTQFSDYLQNYQIQENQASFAFLPYDLIDKDIDIDELTYEENVATFRKYLDSLVRDLRRPFRTEETFIITREVHYPVPKIIQYFPMEDGKTLRSTTEAV